MISKEEWWRIMEAYGARIWPLQIVFYILAILFTLWLFLKPGRVQNIIIKLYVCIAFAWNGIAFFFVIAKDITGNTYGNYLIGALFLVVSLSFVIDLFKQEMEFSLPIVRWQRYATIVLMIIVFCYPWIGVACGHRFPGLIMSGTVPCPTTAFGLLLLTTSLPRVNKMIFILLLFFAVPFTPFIQILRYGVYEDTIMVATGIYSLVLLVKYWKGSELP